jgi:UDP-N-acetylmuramate: L-alanyl-gamma-D-glutamyl-meso-diaminopimelate ligase
MAADEGVCMKVHILGICGTFMAGVALLARELGHEVTGSDANVYPPMSDQLAAAGIDLREGYGADNLDPDADLHIIGNALSRGNEQVEIILERGLDYVSGPQWLSEHVLRDRWVLAVAGTHGKTTTASLLAWILEDAGLDPGFLIGGLTQNFGVSARLGAAPFFVIEADEYDTAFFDKRSKFLHYRPRSLVLNNLEFDHADIFDDLDAIKRQFHHLMRILPRNGLAIVNDSDAALESVLEMGLWSELQRFGPLAGSDLQLLDDDLLLDTASGRSHRLELPLAGRFNRMNAAAALLAARHAGVPIASGVDALSRFQGVKRRQELIAEAGGIRLYEDFAHHPTAIAATLEALRAQTEGRLIAIFEPRSNTMKQGVHRQRLAAAFEAADLAWLYDPGNLDWSLTAVCDERPRAMHAADDLDELIDAVLAQARSGDTLVIMSNGGFGGLPKRLSHALETLS